MPTPELPEAVREQRPEVLAELTELVGVSAALAENATDREQIMADRLARWKRLRALDPPVSWADIARVCGVDSVTVIQAVEGRKSKVKAR